MSDTWTLNRGQVIAGALRQLSVLPSGGSPTTNQTNDAATALNGLVKALHAEGMPLWAIQNITFDTVNGTDTYTIGHGQTIDQAPALKLLQMNRDDQTIPLRIYSEYDFNNLPSTATGTPSIVTYKPLISTGTIQLWPIPDGVYTMHMTYQRPFADLSADGDAFDFPAYWILPLQMLLAWILAPQYGIPVQDRDKLKEDALFWKTEALSFGSEETSITFVPER